MFVRRLLVSSAALLPWRPFIAAGVILAITTSVAAAQVASLSDRARGAEHVVVATVGGVSPSWVQNEFGDRLIVSRVQLVVEETLKGTSHPTLWLDVEGGTLDGVTLKVSSLPLMQNGDRAVFFIEPVADRVYKPYLRGQGILILDDHDVVHGSSLNLDGIRAAVRAGQ